MSVLIGMAVYDPPDGSRHELLSKCLRSLAVTVDWARHSMLIASNGITSASVDAIRDAQDVARTIWPVTHMGSNRGTAAAVNACWKHRKPGQNCAKIDSDIVIHEPGWLDKLEECIARDSRIGLICCKRKDLAENPWAPEGNWEHSDLVMLPHSPGQSWLIVERVHHCLGSCQVYASALLDKIGYLVQFGKYGFDDSLAAVRCKVAGFYSCFYPHFEIDHIDPGATPYQAWKSQYAGERFPAYDRVAKEYLTGVRPVWHGPDENLE